MQGMEGEAMQAQISELQQTFNTAAAAAGSAVPASSTGEEGEEGAAGAAAASQPPAAQQWAVEQMCSLCKLPTATVADKRAVLQFLALHAFVQLDPKAVGKVSVAGLDLMWRAECRAGTSWQASEQQRG
jgi:hypothetical protein